MKRKLLWILMVSCLIILILCCAASAEESWYWKNDPNATATLDDNGVLTIRGSGTIEGYPWMADASYRDSVIEVVIYGPTGIGKDAFSGLKNLKSVYAPQVITVGEGAFSYCPALTDVMLSSKKLIIGDCAFYKCSSLTQSGFTTGREAKSIGKYAYQDCTSLTSFSPESLESIGEGAFFNCTSLKDVTIPNGVTTIEEMTFCNCGKLTRCTLGNSIQTIKSGAFAYCSSLSSLKLPAGIANIAEDAFANVTPVLYADIGTDTAKSLGKINIPFREFYNNSYLLQYMYENGKITNLELISIDKTGNFHTIPDGVTRIREGAAFEHKEMITVTIPSTVKSIGEEAFYGCPKLGRVSIPTGVTTIEKGTFANCSGLNSATLPDTVQTIEEGAFYGCSNLDSLTLPSGLKKIGLGAFENCSKLSSIKIPDGVKEIDKEAFAVCEKLGSVTLPKSITKICNSAFFGCSSLKTVTYAGTMANARGIEAEEGNEYLLYATWNCSDGKFVPGAGSATDPGTPTVTQPETPTETYTTPTTGTDPETPTETYTTPTTGSDPGTPTVTQPETGTEIQIKPTTESDEDITAYLILSKTDLTIKGAKQKTVRVTLTNPKDYIIGVKSNNTKVAKATFSGNDIIITPTKKKGEARITVLSALGGDEDIYVTVKEGWELNEKSITLKKGEKFKIKLSAIPSSIKIKNCESSNSKVAKVDKKGNIKAKKKGKATIKVTLSNGKTLKIKVKVK